MFKYQTLDLSNVLNVQQKPLHDLYHDINSSTLYLIEGERVG